MQCCGYGYALDLKAGSASKSKGGSESPSKANLGAADIHNGAVKGLYSVCHWFQVFHNFVDELDPYWDLRQS
jgi:hypothetical protein